MFYDLQLIWVKFSYVVIKKKKKKKNVGNKGQLILLVLYLHVNNSLC